jgi:hypothetical protein
MLDRIHELLHRNLQEVLAKGTTSAAVRQSRSSTPTTASFMCLPAFSSGTMRWTSSQETCARPTRISCTRLLASRRRATKRRPPGVGSGPRGGKPDDTGLDVIIVLTPEGWPVPARTTWVTRAPAAVADRRWRREFLESSVWMILHRKSDGSASDACF